MIGKRLIGFGLILAAFSGCGDPPRDNPNDPKGDRYYPFGAVSVTAQRRNGSVTAGVTVSVDSRIATTNSNGIATIDNLPAGEYRVKMSGELFVSDSTILTVLPGETATWTKQLNARPHIDSVSVTSELRPPQAPSKTAVHYFAKVTDPDGSADLPDTALTVITSFGSYVLGRIGPTTWQRVDTIFPTWNVQDLVGLPINFIAQDNPPYPFQGGRTISDSVSLIRVFNSNPASQGMTPVNQNPNTLYVQWGQSIGDGFSYTARIKFFSDIDLQHLERDTIRIPKDSTRVRLPNFISTLGTHFFFIEEVDGFGNSSRSETQTVNITN